MPASLKRRLRAVPDPEPKDSTKQAFPSIRQAKAIGLKRKTYPAYIQWAVDYDYADKLSEAERAWLAAFSEEHYRGWALKMETQVHPPASLRESNAAHQRLRRSGDPLSFGEHRDPTALHGQDQRSKNGCVSAGAATELRVAAGSRGMDAHELRGRNIVEDEMVKWLDRPKRVK